MEIWKKVIDTEHYEVSNFGGFKIRGRATYAEYWHTHRSVSWKTVNGELKSCGLHRLVFEYFKHPIPKGFVINHLDGVMCNNHIDNLECVTYSENTKHAYANNLHTTRNYKSWKKSQEAKEKARVAQESKTKPI
jgi:hypothetical protein